MKIDPSKVLRARWSKKLKDVIYYFPSSPDGHLLNTILSGERCHPNTKSPGWLGYEWGPSFLQELEDRGYDITTLKFSIRKK